MRIVGNALAEQIASLLERGLTISYEHRDYCGVGLRYCEGTFIYDESHEGWIISDEELAKFRATASKQRLTFGDRGQFVKWLAGQSNSSLSGEELSDSWLTNNQRLTIERLAKIAEQCSSDPRPRWDGRTLGG